MQMGLKDLLLGNRQTILYFQLMEYKYFPSCPNAFEQELAIEEVAKNLLLRQ
jgi:hypothetical protein